MTAKPNLQPDDAPGRPAPSLALIQRFLRFFVADSRGATMLEQTLLVALALTGAVGFSKFGTSLNGQLKREAAHIEGKGMPANGDLMAPLTASFQVPDLGCNGDNCTLGSGRCFAEGTLVATESGEKPIEAVRVGERVWARDERSGETALRPVTHRFITTDADVIEVALRSRDWGQERILVTPTHHFWVEGQGWVPAMELSATPLGGSGSSGLVASARASKSAVTTVYNLEVADFHSYFVGRTRALVHNGGVDLEKYDCPPRGATGGTGTPANGNAAAVQPPNASAAPPPILLTKAQEKRKAECMKALGKIRGLTYVKNDRQKTSRPRDRDAAIEKLCSEMATECPPEVSTKDCIERWECIFRYVAGSRGTGYFDDVSSAAEDSSDEEDDNADETSSRNGPRSYVRGICLSKQIKEWACKKPVFPPVKPFYLSSEKNDPKGTPDDPRSGNVSQRAGDQAANNFMNQNYPPPYECYDTGAFGQHTEVGGANVFDIVCFDPDSGNVAIIEAKGGTNGPGKRKNEKGDAYVQQGTKAYALAIAKELEEAEARGNPRGGGKRVAKAVREAIEGKKARYFMITQPFDEKGYPEDPKLEEFDLDNKDSSCRNCRCGT